MMIALGVRQPSLAVSLGTLMRCRNGCAFSHLDDTHPQGALGLTAHVHPLQVAGAWLWSWLQLKPGPEPARGVLTHCEHRAWLGCVQVRITLCTRSLENQYFPICQVCTSGALQSAYQLMLGI